MARDPYEVLGVARDASQDDIRKAYRELAKKLHPDLNPGDKAAVERFQEVSAAYDVLKDPETRARYDRGEIDASGAEKPEQKFYRDFADAGGARHYHSTAGFEDLGDISELFADLFGAGGGAGAGPRARAGGGFRARGADVRYQLDLGFLEAVKGVAKTITPPDGKPIKLTIPPGARDGQTLRLKGKGGAGIGGGPNGDALIELNVRPHPYFKREGDDIVLELPISLDEAVLGGKVEAPTIDGKVAITVPKGASGGQVLRLRERGAPKAGGKRGDQLVRLNIVTPETIDEDLGKAMEAWRETHAYDPRKGLWSGS
ncbi:MAG: J domain-containing protein [Maricaulaceae bacterium]|jgi:DnaJ-class molecular chaperone